MLRHIVDLLNYVHSMVHRTRNYIVTIVVICLFVQIIGTHTFEKYTQEWEETGAIDYKVRVKCSCGKVASASYGKQTGSRPKDYSDGITSAFASAHNLSLKYSFMGDYDGSYRKIYTLCPTNCGSRILLRTTTHDHGIDGTHYVCETHNYVGTSQLH